MLPAYQTVGGRVPSAVGTVAWSQQLENKDEEFLKRLGKDNVSTFICTNALPQYDFLMKELISLVS